MVSDALQDELKDRNRRKQILSGTVEAAPLNKNIELTFTQSI
ncbi:MAG: hypothetical protein M5U10_10485 [Candidatus Methanoperedens sp.]|nr:hypothetical protein [Candidatus Methanoperedens sp.]